MGDSRAIYVVSTMVTGAETWCLRPPSHGVASASEFSRGGVVSDGDPPLGPSERRSQVAS